MLRRALAAAAFTALRRLEDLQSIQRPLMLLHQIPTVHVPIGASPSCSRSFSFLTHTRSRMARRVPPVRPDNYSDSDSESDKEENKEMVDSAAEEEEGEGEPGEYEGVMFEWGYDSDGEEEEEKEEEENKK